jgi:hypothetical protein
MTDGHDLPSAARLVCGTVTGPAGRPVPDLTVRALDRDLRSFELLGEAVTDAAGRYAVEYGPDAAVAGEAAGAGRRADLEVVVLRGDAELGRSPVRFNAADREQVDLTVSVEPAGGSEYERYLALLEPALTGVRLADLREDAEVQDVTFLVGETGIPRDRLELLIRAAREAAVRDGGLPIEVPAAAWYAWLRFGLPAEREALLRTPPSVLAGTLKRAVGQRVVPERVAALIPRLTAALRNRRAEEMLRPAERDTPAGLGDVLATAPAGAELDGDQARGLALLVAERTADDDTLARAAQAHGIDLPRLRAVRRGLALSRVAGGDVGLLRAARVALPALSDGCADLPYAAVAAMTEADWTQALAAAGVDDPTERSRRATEATRRAAELFPHDALLAPAARRPAVDALAELVDRADTEPDGAAARELAGWDAGFTGLGLAEVLAAGGTAGERAAELDRRLGVLGAVYAANADVPLLELDYLPDGDAGELLVLRGVPEADRPRVVGTLKAMRRVQEVTGLASDTRRLLAAGFGSAARLAAADPAAVAECAGLEQAVATHYVTAARERAGTAALHLFSANDVVRQPGQGQDAPFASVAVADWFTRIPGYAELFGDTGFCACRHCRSVLSPAAYLVDLTWFVQRRLTAPAFAVAPANHPLRLKVRRPDLWSLPLTCENTDALVPYLDIVNEVLEAHVAAALRGGGSALDRPAVYRRLARTAGSVAQPFHLPLERAAAYLGHFGRTRADAARTLGSGEQATARAVLGISLTEWDLLARPRATDTAFLTGMFGAAIVQAATAGGPVEVPALLTATGWTRDALGQLIAAPVVRGADQPAIRAEKRDQASVQRDVERVYGLTVGVLDRLHRTWRLHAATGVPVPALNLALRALPAPAASSDETARLLGLVGLLEAGRRLAVPLDAACALTGPIPTEPLEPGGSTLFDRLFNLEPFVTQQGRWPQQLPASFVHPSFAAGASTPDNRTLQRLLAGLQVADADLVALLAGLGLATAAQPSVALTTDVLALLYRHALLARTLGLPVADLVRLLRLSGVGPVRDRAGLDRLFAADADRRALGIPLDDAAFVIEAVTATPAHPRPDEVAAALAERLGRERRWEFADTLLAALPGVSEADSQRILAANTAAAATDPVADRPLEPTPGSSLLRLRAGADPTVAGWAPALPAGYQLPTGVGIGQLAAALRRFDPLDAVGEALADRLRITRDALTELLRLCGPANAVNQPLSGSRAAAVAAGYAADPAALRAALLTGRPALLRLAVLFALPGWTTAALRQVADDRDRAQPLGIVFDPAAVDLSWRAVAEARLVSSLAVEPLDPACPDAPTADPAALIRVLAVTDWTSTANDADLAAALGTDRPRIAALRPHLPLAAVTRPVRRLERLRDALRLTGLLGISGETLRTLVPAVPPAGGTAAADAEYDALAQGADALYGVLRTTYPDPAVFEERLSPFEDRMRGRRRDALVDFMLHPGDTVLPLRFASVSELYGYFLLDVEMGGCARTSRIVAATQSVQLYVHRVLMVLEAGMWTGTPAGTRERAVAAVRAQWTWRRSYRVWEANRRIFLNPESYLEPELRDDRTPLFAEAADELLQQETTEQTVTDAYTRYLTGLEELIGLRIAGAFHQPGTGTDPDVLHLVGVTSADPPEHYYRAVRGVRTQVAAPKAAQAVFGAWERIGVQIPVRDVTPAVIGGRLHLFWMQSATQVVNSMRDGDSSFSGYRHELSARFCVRRPDGRWAPAQPMTVLEASGRVRKALQDPVTLRMQVIHDELGNQPPSTMKTYVPKLTEQEGVRETDHDEPHDGYTLPGPLLPYVHLDMLDRGPAGIQLQAVVAGLLTNLDLFRREALDQNIDPRDAESIEVDDLLAIAPAAGGIELYANRLSHDGFSSGSWAVHAFVARESLQPRQPGRAWQTALATLPAGSRRVVVGKALGNPAVTPVERLGFDLAVEIDRQPVLALAAAGSHWMMRLGSGLGSRLARRLAEAGLDGLLGTAFQEGSAEPALPVTPVPGRIAVPAAPPTRGGLDVGGPLGTYLREVWFELPYLIAVHLNAQQRFAAAQRWYHRLFDPTAEGAADDRDRVWRYRGFRGVTASSLRAALTDGAALAAYRNDPFNPHAVARLRPGAHQRAVVMKYLDNLLDWGDALFAEFTRESLNEATMLYVLAADILGPRPAPVGDCGDAGRTLTYADLEPVLGDTSDFLIELELVDNRKPFPAKGSGSNRTLRLDARLLDGDVPRARAHRSAPVAVRAAAVAGEPLGDAFGEPDGDWFGDGAVGSLWRRAGGQPVVAAAEVDPARPTVAGSWERPPISVSGGAVHPTPETILGPRLERRPFGPDTLIPFDERQPDDRHPPIGWEGPVLELAEQAAARVPAFCVPPNRELLALWDRVEDRLTKLRNCLDLTGARREPSLFAPEIDPLLLARARAAGLSLEDVLAPGSGSVPPYRFPFLIDRARQYAQTVQNFGNALLAALERKDAEELARLRSTHERNLLRMRTRVLEWEVAAADDATAAVQRQRELVEYRRGYYDTLGTTGLLQQEKVQLAARHTATLTHITATAIAYGSALAKSIPNAGSPFAMTYGGIQVGGALGAIAGAFASTAASAEAVSTSAGMEATFHRRTEEWQHQRKLELVHLDRQLAAAQVRADIARRSLEVHQLSLEQAEEVLDLQDGRFTSLGRYTALATRLHRLHREAFTTALGVARMAERAFAFERGDDAAVALAGGYWDADGAGLGAGDALLVDLLRLEQRYLETHLRTLEVEQSFSVATLSPVALLSLRETGSCSFAIPEAAFDLAYPGQYRRRIRAVRVSIPCVTGPYVNVPATLRLVRSVIRRRPRLDDVPVEVPLRHTTQVATSSGQADGGVFEFTFRDERFLPFEGAGAVSEWRLELPATFRPFAYRTVSDVILRIGYTAEHDAVFGADVTAATTTAAGSLRRELGASGLPVLLSLRQDAPEAWRRLLDEPAGTEVTLPLDPRHLPGVLVDWLTGRPLPAGTQPRLSIGGAVVALVTASGAARERPTATLSAALGTGALGALSFGVTPGQLGLYEATLGGTANLDQPAASVPVTLRVDTAGNLAPPAPAAPGPGGPAATLDETRLLDVVVLLIAKLATAP